MTRAELDAAKVPSALHFAHREGRPILLVGRNSSPTGKRAYQLAVDDALGAAEVLADLGVDVRDALADRADLMEQLRACEAQKSIANDKSVFANRFLRIDLRRSHGVIIVISAGTGKKVDKQGSQPFVSYVADVVRRTRACAVVAKRLDRVSRNAWALGPAMVALQQTDGYLVDHGRIRPAQGVEGVITFLEAQAGEEEAEKLPRKTANGLVKNTDRSMAGGFCRVGHAHPLPIGLFSYRQRDDGRLGARMIAFDSPDCYPAPETVAVGLPDVRDERGELVNQVENVRWALSRIGRPGESASRIAEEFVRRRLSSEGLRRNHASNAFVTDEAAKDRPMAIVDRIVRHLEFYETGELPVRIGIDGFEDFVITDCFPPDGKKWATPRDFERIRQWRDSRKPDVQRSLSVSGLRVTADGKDCVLLTTSRLDANGERIYMANAVLADPYFDHSGAESPGFTALLPPDLVTTALADALIGAGEAALPISPLEVDDEGSLKFQRQVAMAEAELRALEDARDAIAEQVRQRAPDGSPLLSGPLLERASHDYERLVVSDIPLATRRIAQCHEEEASERQRKLKGDCGAALDALLTLIATLRDPFDCTNRDVLVSGIRDMAITTTAHSYHRVEWRDYDITFDFRINDGDSVITIPVGTSFTRGYPLAPERIGAETLERLCSEEVFLEGLDIPYPRETALLLAELLGVDGSRFLLPKVLDGRLSRLAALVLNGRDPVATAATTGEPVVLLERILEIHLNAQRREPWLKRGSWLYAMMLELASRGQAVTLQDVSERCSTKLETVKRALRQSSSANQWEEVGPGVYRLTPCPHCGSGSRVSMAIREPFGLVCMSCRRDQAGVHWPTDPYDVYVVPTTKQGRRMMMTSAGAPRRRNRRDHGRDIQAPAP